MHGHVCAALVKAKLATDAHVTEYVAAGHEYPAGHVYKCGSGCMQHVEEGYEGHGCGGGGCSLPPVYGPPAGPLGAG